MGRVTRPHSVRGEVRIEILTDFPEDRFAPGSRLFIGDEAAVQVSPVVVRSARRHKGVFLVSLDVARDRSAAEALRGLFVFVDASEAKPLGPDTYYHHDLVGCGVDTTSGAYVGDVSGVMETGSADVLVIRRPNGAREALLPMIGDVVLEVDLAGRRILIEPMPGLLDDEPSSGAAETATEQPRGASTSP